MKIGTTAGKIFYVHCFRPFSKRNQGKKEKRHQSASVDSHSAPVFFCLVCFLSRCFFVAAFTLFAPFQLGLNIFMSFFMCIFLYVCRFMFLVSLPCPPCSPPSFLSVLAWHGTHDAGQTCCNIFYLRCVGPLSGRNHTKKEGASNLSEFILRSFPLIVSCLAV